MSAIEFEDDLVPRFVPPELSQRKSISPADVITIQKLRRWLSPLLTMQSGVLFEPRFTQASTVKPVAKRRSAASGTTARSFEPSNWSALPVTPAVQSGSAVSGAPGEEPSDPACPSPVASAKVWPAPSSNGQAPLPVEGPPGVV